jgi:hypothetical protein
MNGGDLHSGIGVAVSGAGQRGSGERLQDQLGTRPAHPETKLQRLGYELEEYMVLGRHVFVVRAQLGDTTEQVPL